MKKAAITSPGVVWAVCILQFVPLMLFPPQTYSPASQEWWLPVLCALMALFGILQLMIRRSVQLWPWYILSFAHGVNIISRLMLFLPRATRNVKGTLLLNTLYLSLSVLAMLMSAFLLWYFEQHAVRITFLSKRVVGKSPA
jgi:hypothetical protein